MPNPVRRSLYTLPFGRDLCDATVSEIFSRVGNDPLALSNVILLLPNNRAVKSMTDAFVRQLKPGLLLPRMAAVGDLGLDESLGPLLDPLDSASVILPAIEPMRRLLLLTRLVLKQRAAAGANVTTTEALRFAKKLAEVIDELEIEQIDFAEFDNIQPEAQDLAGHWQSSYADLLQLIPAYQKELAAIGCIGPSARRNILLARLAKYFADHPPAGWIIAAGLSTAAPAVAKLLRNVAMLPQSMVILPSIDLDMTDSQ
ncbi:MAG: double-strand break repair protein AddB, partial [Sphingorhabdus sp.]|nr:double-strand break repair protein AddB [Sphingorhabdus sp.]